MLIFRGLAVADCGKVQVEATVRTVKP